MHRCARSLQLGVGCEPWEMRLGPALVASNVVKARRLRRENRTSLGSNLLLVTSALLVVTSASLLVTNALLVVRHLLLLAMHLLLLKNRVPKNPKSKCRALMFSKGSVVCRSPTLEPGPFRLPVGVSAGEGMLELQSQNLKHYITHAKPEATAWSPSLLGTRSYW